MLITCCENENKCQALQRLSKDCQDNSPLIFRIMDHITANKVIQQNISPVWQNPAD
ncbi:hypothetical protein KVMX100_120539 [Klebsiella variicola]|nr:hypothetical protein KVMX100_120539 [Klebsiella variicola]